MATRKLTPEQKERKLERQRLRRRSKPATPEERAAKREYDIAHRSANRERIRSRRLAKREVNRAQCREWKRKHPEHVKAYRETHKAEMRVWEASYRAEHREDVAARQKRYREAHPDRAATISRNNKARRRSAPGRHTAADVLALFDAQRGACAVCAVELVAKGRGKYHVDHVMPVKLGGSNGPENLQLLCPPCNLSKHAKHPDDWAARRAL